ncbi:MAG: leucyl/phenylalanyl-tRNA--protein transferase, partial [Planctomycetota bacterium]
SIEAWRDERLVGGLYGVSLRSAFFGESMFVRPELGGTDASKVCFVALVAHLRNRGYTLLDAQMMSQHLARLGGIPVDDRAYQVLLNAALERTDVSWGTFESESLLAPWRQIGNRPEGVVGP